MRDNCPAAVHVDGTARPQLIRREINPGYYDDFIFDFEWETDATASTGHWELGEPIETTSFLATIAALTTVA